MAQPLSILIADADRYFANGLRLGLQGFFQSRAQDVHLLDETQTDGAVDIVFLGNITTNPPWLYQLHQRNCHPLVFFIKQRGRNKETFERGGRCEKCNAGTLYRHQTLFVLLELLNAALDSQSPLSSAFHRSCQCMFPLTPRETDVLRCIYQGMNGRDTGAYLDINEKTANAHKQSAMRKLNFRCNQELYQWLLQGGGHYLNELAQAQSPHPPQVSRPSAANSVHQLGEKTHASGQVKTPTARTYSQGILVSESRCR